MKNSQNKILKRFNKKTILDFSKFCFFAAILLIGFARILYTYNLPNFYLKNMQYDDFLMIKLLNSLKDENYLGPYDTKNLIKGPLFSFLIFIINMHKASYCNIFTILYILASLYFIFSLKNVIENKKLLCFIFFILLFNPATYSQDIFQRLYRNSISITEFVFFLGCVIRVLFSSNKKVLNYSLLGVSLALMFLTREDNIWTYPILLLIIVYSIIKNNSLKPVLLNIIPIVIIMICLNIVSFFNYKYYGIYTYNELQQSEFHNTYKKILQIKDKDKKSQVSIPKSTLYLLSEKTKTFNLTRFDIDKYYSRYADKNGEISNGNIIWYFRNMVYYKNKFDSGFESEKFYKELGEELDHLFSDGTLQKEFVMPSMFMSIPTKEELKQLPGNLLYAIYYTSTYQNIKTMTSTEDYDFNKGVNAYYFNYEDYHDTVSIVKNNSTKYEIFRLLYKYFTVIFSVVALIIYFKNIKKLDKLNLISHILLMCYLLILGGVVYTHTTSFHAIRPLYLGNIYIIQDLFILVQLCRFFLNKKNKLFEIKKPLKMLP